MKTLIVFTKRFPYFPGEEFIESEYKYWAAFDRIIIVPCAGRADGEPRRLDEINPEIIRMDRIHLGDMLRGAIWAASQKKFRQDLTRCFCKSVKMTYLSIRKLLSLMAWVHVKQLELNEQLKDMNIDFSSCVCYAYWLGGPSYLALMIKNDHPAVKVASRCHGGDLYEYANYGYLPLRRHLISSLDALYCISDSGKQYVNEHYNVKKPSIEISRLGTVQAGTPRFPRRDSVFKIVSCSYMVPVKRIDRIIRALSLIPDRGIEWVHFGGGEWFDDLNKMAEKAFLKSRISYRFPGRLANKQILEYYKDNDVNLFINVSESEGVPVSIMEAISFGIPVIATGVGGTPEIVESEKNGLLISRDFSDDDLKNAIVRFIEMDAMEYVNYQKNARALWEEKYMADKNYMEFINQLLHL